MSDDFKHSNVVLVAVIIGGVVFLVGIVGILINLG